MSEASRRDFLRKATAAAAAAAALSADRTVHGDEDDAEPIPQAKPRAPIGADGIVNVAVIGTGGMGTGHADALAKFAAESKTIRLAALCDVCDPRVKNAKARVDATHYLMILTGQVCVVMELRRPDTGEASWSRPR